MNKFYNEEEEVLDVNENKNILIFGKEKVGKTSLISRISEDLFEEENTTMSGKNYFKFSTDDRKIIKINLFESTPNYDYNFSEIKYDGIIFIYDTTEVESADNISESIKYFKKEKGEDFPMILLGNKIDKIDEKRKNAIQNFGEDLAKNNGITFFEISCKEGKNVKNAAEFLVKKILEKEKNSKIKEKEQMFNINIIKIKKEDGCCHCF